MWSDEEILSRVEDDIKSLILRDFIRSVFPGFDDKKTYYKKSKWRTERELTKIDEWSIDAINQREKEMIAFAINRWSTHNI